LAEQDNRVTIPFARAIAERIPPVAVRLRRDFGSILALIRAHAVLHQASRERDEAGRIVATVDDYAVVRDLVADIVSEGVGTTVSDAVRETVYAVEALAPASVGGVMAKAVADRLNLDKSNASRRLRLAGDGGYIRNLEDKRGKPGRWVIGDPLPETVDLLPDPAQLRNPSQQPDQGGCAVAQGSEGEKGNQQWPEPTSSPALPSPPASTAEPTSTSTHPKTDMTPVGVADVAPASPAPSVPIGEPCPDPTHTPRWHGGNDWSCPDCEEAAP
jgi:hypothetical protein